MLQWLRSLWVRVPLWLIGLTAGLTIVLYEWETPGGFWDGKATWAFVATVVLVVVSWVEPIRAAIAHLIERRAQQRAALVEEVLHSTLVLIDTATAQALKWHDIGIHVWEVAGPFSWGPLDRTLYLKKVARIRVKRDDRGGAGITWRRGKGAIGRCWESGEGVVVDASAFPPLSIDDWNKLPASQKMGLDWDEAQRAKGYGCIVVRPMIDSKNNFRGCVSADGPEGTFQTMSKGEVQRLVQQCANVCAEKLYGTN